MMPESGKSRMILVTEGGQSVVAPTSFDLEANPECRFDLGVRRLYQAAVNLNWGTRFGGGGDGSRLH